MYNDLTPKPNFFDVCLISQKNDNQQNLIDFPPGVIYMTAKWKSVHKIMTIGNR